MDSIAERLSTQLETIVSRMDALLDASKIKDNRARNEGFLRDGIFILYADFDWGPLDDEQRRLQRELLELWTPWSEQVHLLFSGDTTKTQEVITEAEKKVSSWIQRDDPDRDRSIPSSVIEAKRIFRGIVAPFVQLLHSVSKAPGDVIAVPDTNVLLRQPDVTKYADVLGTDKYTVLLTPGVLREMDEHKTNRKNEAVREKARAFGGRIKGWRNQGNLAKGVKVQGNTYVRVEGREPDFDETLEWLDPDVADDRIIASILEVQRSSPSAKIVLLTGDATMLAKADAASIPTADTPDPEV